MPLCSGSMSGRYPIAVLVSGSGSNLQAILDASQRPDYPAEVVIVISDRPGVLALERARSAAVRAEVIAWSDHRERGVFTKAVCEAAVAHGAEALVLAGFLRILGAEAVERFPDRIVNIHPSLLPAFPGTIHAVEEALERGVKVTGVTVHFVSEAVDEGPIIAQEAVGIQPDDDVSSLHARLQQVEHRIYPEVVAALATDRLHVSGSNVTWVDL